MNLSEHREEASVPCEMGTIHVCLGASLTLPPQGVAVVGHGPRSGSRDVSKSDEPQWEGYPGGWI